MLKFCIYGQKMELINRQTIADQQICFVDMCFLFSPDWEQLDKTAQFAQGEKTYNVHLGTDNVCDAMVPWNAGDMWHEMTTLATGCRFDYFDELVKIATVNGRKAIGID